MLFRSDEFRLQVSKSIENLLSRKIAFVQGQEGLDTFLSTNAESSENDSPLISQNEMQVAFETYWEENEGENNVVSGIVARVSEGKTAELVDWVVEELKENINLSIHFSKEAKSYLRGLGISRRKKKTELELEEE